MAKTQLAPPHLVQRQGIIGDLHKPHELMEHRWGACAHPLVRCASAMLVYTSDVRVAAAGIPHAYTIRCVALTTMTAYSACQLLPEHLPLWSARHGVYGLSTCPPGGHLHLTAIRF